jgi:mannose-6-phosphate isomerase-like protein (cupin superfamily)
MSTMAVPAPFTLPKEVVDSLPWEPLAGCTGVINKTVYRAGDVVAGLVWMRPGAAETPHLHGHGQHHVWVLEGTIRIGETELPAGSYLHVPEGLLHAVRDAGDGSLVFYVFTASR